MERLKLWHTVFIETKTLRLNNTGLNTQIESIKDWNPYTISQNVFICQIYRITINKRWTATTTKTKKSISCSC